MSVEAITEVWKLDLPRDQKLVLLAFADHADDFGRCYPSLARVAWKSGYEQTRTISQIVAKLVDEGVLEILEPARGRTPTLYRIRWDRGIPLPEFDPQEFKTGKPRGAENAPLPENGHSANSDDPKSLNDNVGNSARGAENAPHEHGVQKTHPIGSVGVRSDDRRGAFSGRRGALATAPESLTINQRRAGARASESRAPASETDIARVAEIRKLNGLAKRIGAELVTPNEPLEHAKQRIESGYTTWLADQAEKQSADRRQAEALAGAQA